MIEKTLTVSEVKQILNIGLNQIYLLLKEKKIPGFKLGRVWKIPQKTFDDWLWHKATENISPEMRAGMTAVQQIKAKIESQNRDRHLEWDEAKKEFKVVNGSW